MINFILLFMFEIFQSALNLLDAGKRSIFESNVQKVRKHNWSQIWNEGIPNMDNTLIL